MTQIKTDAFILNPIMPEAAAPGSIFLDITNNNTLSAKSMGGVVVSLSSTTTSESSLFNRQMQAGQPFSARVPLSKRPDGRVIAADSDAIEGQQVIGYSLSEATAANDLVNVLTIGAVIEGALTGLGFVPGETIFLSENGGYTNDPNSFTGNNDSIIKVGIADCPAGAASSIATDLVMSTDVIMRP